jgi:hypothetical protein
VVGGHWQEKYPTITGIMWSVLIAAILLGILLATTLGGAMAGAQISTFGAASFSIKISPVEDYLASPLLMIFTVFAATVIGTLDAGEIHIAENIKE